MRSATSSGNTATSSGTYGRPTKHKEAPSVMAGLTCSFLLLITHCYRYAKIMVASDLLPQKLAPSFSGQAQTLTTKTLTFADLKKHRVTHTTNHPAPTPVICIAGAKYGLRGMISALTGPPKSGKTTVIGFMLATALAYVSDPAETLNIRSALAGKRDVVYLDFEQHVSSTQDLHDKVLRYAHLNSCPDNLHVLSLLELTIEERLQAVRSAFDELDIHLLIIDGLADLLPGVNDEEKSNALIEELALLASKHNTCMIVVVHENKGGGTVRGHLGSQIMRKCAGLIAVRKDRVHKIHSIESQMIRVGDDFEDVCFRYSPEHGQMILLDALSAEDHKNRTAQKKAGKDNDTEYLTGLITLCFGNMATLTKAELIKGICKFDKDAGSDKTAMRRIKGAVTLGILEQDGDTYARPQ